MKITSKLIAFFMTTIMISCLTGCVANISIYDHSDNYTSGDFETTNEVTDLKINWSSGKVNVSYHDKDTISVTETCNVELKDSHKVHTWLDGKTLNIRFCKSGESFNLTNAEKKLEVKLPRNTELANLSYNGSSASASFNDISATDFNVNTSSGSVKLSECSATTFILDSSSGSIHLDQKGESEKIKANASSGSVIINSQTVNNLSADTSSGQIELKVNSAEDISTNASSGKTELHLSKIPSKTKIDASSGDITLYVPKDADFSADVDTASGDFNSEIPLSNKDNLYISGSGANTIKINTSSGDVQIKVEK